MQAARARVAIVSDHDVMWNGLATLVTGVRGAELVGTRSVGDLLAGDRPVLVLYDAGRLATPDGGDLRRLVDEEAIVVVVVTRDLRSDLTDRARDAGADLFVSAHATAREIRSAVRDAADLPDGAGGPGGAGGVPRLSPRERDVLVRIASGLSNKEICEELFLSINSVKTHIRSAYRKIEVVSRAQAVRWCLSNGLSG